MLVNLLLLTRQSIHRKRHLLHIVQLFKDINRDLEFAQTAVNGQEILVSSAESKIITVNFWPACGQGMNHTSRGGLMITNKGTHRFNTMHVGRFVWASARLLMTIYIKSFKWNNKKIFLSFVQI